MSWALINIRKKLVSDIKLDKTWRETYLTDTVPEKYPAHLNKQGLSRAKVEQLMKSPKRFEKLETKKATGLDNLPHKLLNSGQVFWHHL